MKEEYKKYGLIALILAVIALYLMLYNKWESFAVQTTLNNGRKLVEKTGIYSGIEDGSYTPGTITEPMQEYINKVLGGVLNQINEKTGSRYFLRKIDHVNVVPISKGFVGCEGDNTFLQSGCQSVNNAANELQLGLRYTVDFFAHELKNQETRRFIVIFIVNTNGDVQIEHFNLSNAFSLPDKVFLDASDAVDPLSDLIIKDAAMGPIENTPTIMGIPSSSLDFTIFKPDGPGGATNSAVLGNLFFPLAIQSKGDDGIKYGAPHPNQRWPARKHGKWWDLNGVADVESQNIERRGLDHAIEVRPLQNYDNPTVARSEGDAYNNANHWLFDRARGSLRQAQQI